jgi:hypothetical protein
MGDAHKNFAYSLVATAPSPASSGTSLVCTAADGAKFPLPPFNMTIWPAGAQPLTSNAEEVTVNAISTDTFTIVRAQEGSSARTVVVGDQIGATISAKTLNDVEGNRVPTTDEVIQAGYSKVIPRKLTIASGKKYAIRSGAILRIL